MVPWLKTQLGSLGSSNGGDDVVLEVVILIGTVCADAPAALMLATEGLVQLLIDLLNAKQEDDEVVLQIVYVFYQLVLHADTKDVLIRDTQGWWMEVGFKGKHRVYLPLSFNGFVGTSHFIH